MARPVLKRPAALQKRPVAVLKRPIGVSKRPVAVKKKHADAQKMPAGKAFADVTQESLVEGMINPVVQVVDMWSTKGGNNSFSYAAHITWTTPTNCPRPRGGGYAVWLATIIPTVEADSDWTCGHIVDIRFHRWMHPMEYSCLKEVK